MYTYIKDLIPYKKIHNTFGVYLWGWLYLWGLGPKKERIVFQASIF